MNINEISQAIAGLSETDLAQVETSMKEARAAKRPGIDLDIIKPGMSADESARVRAEINRLLSGK